MTLPDLVLKPVPETVIALQPVLFRPTAPALKTPRYAGRVIPQDVMPHVKGRTTVFETPRDGHLLYIEKRGKALQHEACFLPAGAEKPIRLGAGLSWSPFPHAWAGDDRLYIAAKHELYRVTFPDRQATLIDRRAGGQRFASVSATAALYATEDSDHFTVRSTTDDGIVLQERGSEGLVRFIGDRLLLQSSLGVTRLYTVGEGGLELVAGRSQQAMDCWEEGGEVFVNLSIDQLTGRRELTDLVRTYRLEIG